VLSFSHFYRMFSLVNRRL